MPGGWLSAAKRAAPVTFRNPSRRVIGWPMLEPWRARAAEAELVGADANQASFARAADIALADAKPSGDNAFKIEFGRRIVRRALLAALAGTPARVAALPASPFSAMPGVPA